MNILQRLLELAAEGGSIEPTELFEALNRAVPEGHSLSDKLTRQELSGLQSITKDLFNALVETDEKMAVRIGNLSVQVKEALDTKIDSQPPAEPTIDAAETITDQASLTIPSGLVGRQDHTNGSANATQQGLSLHAYKIDGLGKEFHSFADASRHVIEALDGDPGNGPSRKVLQVKTPIQASFKGAPSSTESMDTSQLDPMHQQMLVLNSRAIRQAARSGGQVLQAADSFCGMPEQLEFQPCTPFPAVRPLADAIGKIEIPTMHGMFRKGLAPTYVDLADWDSCTPNTPKPPCLEFGCSTIEAIRLKPELICASIPSLSVISDPYYLEEIIGIVRASLALKLEKDLHASLEAGANAVITHASAYSAFRDLNRAVENTVARFQQKFGSEVAIHIAMPTFYKHTLRADIGNSEKYEDIESIWAAWEASQKSENNVTIHWISTSDSSGNNVLDLATGVVGPTGILWPNKARLYVWSEGAHIVGETGIESIGFGGSVADPSTLSFDLASSDASQVPDANRRRVFAETAIGYLRRDCGDVEVHDVPTCDMANYPAPVTVDCNVHSKVAA